MILRKTKRNSSNNNLFSHHNNNYIYNVFKKKNDAKQQRPYNHPAIYLGFGLGLGLTLGLGFNITVRWIPNERLYNSIPVYSVLEKKDCIIPFVMKNSSSLVKILF